MTRWARGDNSNKKKEHEATSWNVLKQKSRTETKPKHEQQQLIHKTKNRLKAAESLEGNVVSSKSDVEGKKVKTKKRKGLLATLMPDSAEISKQNDNDSDREVSETPVGLAGQLEKGVPSCSNDSDSLPVVDELYKVAKKEVKREKRRLNRIDQRSSEKNCYKCRKPGHSMQECPLAKTDVMDGTGICFKCGSTEHSIKQCTVKVAKGEFPYAKCFVCKEMGHLSSQCPDNPKGLYPNGGCCRTCASVEHYNRDCPEQQKKQGIENMVLDTWAPGLSADEEITLQNTTTSKTKSKFKVVKF